MTTRTKGNNRRTRIPNGWDGLLRRIRKDKPEFRKLSFNKLRKTGADLVKRFSDGETAAVYLAHGQSVLSDCLADRYTNRHFDRVFAALDAVAEHLAPMFGRVEDPFPTEKKGKPSLSLGTIRRIKSLREQGLTMEKVAKECGVCVDTVRRYTRDGQPRLRG